LRISQKEYEALIKEISERMMDIVLESYPKKLMSAYPKEYVERLMSSVHSDTITFDYHVTMTIDDFVQIVSRLRRKGVKH